MVNGVTMPPTPSQVRLPTSMNGGGSSNGK